LLLAERANYSDGQGAREKAAEQLPERERKRAEALAQKFVAAAERPADGLPPQLGTAGGP
jgi:hypothetical protein